MIALGLARAQLARPTVRAVVVVAAMAGAWFAWSPGTRFGLAGAYGGWLYASIRLLDVGLVPLAVVGALCGATPRDRRLDEQLRVAGLAPRRVVRAVVASGALVAIAVAVGFVVGALAGGWLRALIEGGSWWAGPAASAGVGTDALHDVRLVMAVALVGAIGALLGWIVRRDDVAVGLAVVLGIGYLPEASAVLGRLPVTIDGLAFSPLGALRVATLGDRGLAAAGYTRPAAAWPFGLVLVGWCFVLVAFALPGRRRPRPASPSASRSPLPVARIVTVVVAMMATVGFGWVVPGRAADALPWRWQRSWRQAEQAGWSSPQTVDRYLQALRSDPPDDVSELLLTTDAVSPAVAGSIPRASHVERQSVATMAAPDHVVVRLDFAAPIVSGSAAFSTYVVRFTLQSDDDQHWHIVGSEGPVASTPAAAAGSGGS